MNAIRKYIFLSFLASLPFTGGGLFAQTANEGTFKLRALKSSNQSRTASESKEKMRIGYCTTDVSRGLIAQITGSHTYHAATYRGRKPSHHGPERAQNGGAERKPPQR